MKDTQGSPESIDVRVAELLAKSTRKRSMSEGVGVRKDSGQLRANQREQQHE